MFDPIRVLYTTTDESYEQGYEICIAQHPEASFVPEGPTGLGLDFQDQVGSFLEWSGSDYISFFCDDDIFIRPFTDHPSPERILRLDNRVICVSLRLGINTTNCYPLNREQESPSTQYAVHDALYWEWIGADGDWGYPGSLDGHVFRRNTLLSLLREVEFKNPNQLEETLAKLCFALREQELMACYWNSVVTGIPINRVNDTHPNRYGETVMMDTEALNHNYLEGGRLNLGNIRKKQITAAHNEIKLAFA